MLLFPLKLARTFVKVAGIRGALLLAVGVGIGLLIAPTSGERLRAKLKAKLAAGTDASYSSAPPAG
jgi:gas vesicle protein